MVNYACAFSQSELENYFEWIIITFKATCRLAPSYICELINIKESEGYSLRSNKGLLLQAPRAITFIRHLVTAPSWLRHKDRVEQLAANIRNEENFNTFKILLETHCFLTSFLLGPIDIFKIFKHLFLTFYSFFVS